jgi:pSer/pThr/pTyr-binding forkhead associated (FHA) protein
MINRSGSLFLLLCMLAGALLQAPGAVRAGSDGTEAAFFALQTNQFPEISGYLDVRSSQGQFVRGLQAQQVTVIEDGRPIQPQEFEALYPGAKFVIALNPGRSFAIRDGQGVSRYDQVVDHLHTWAESRPDVGDEFSLLIADGPQVLNVSSPALMTNALLEFDDDFRSDEPGLEVLTLALEAASLVDERPGAGRAVLFITPPLDASFAMGLDTIASQAAQRGIRISVWFVSSPDSFSSRSFGLLQELAFRTGGELAGFSGTEALPDIERYLDPLREVYRITYISQIREGGQHPVQIEIDMGREKVLSSIQSYFMDIQPPSPILVMLPSQIKRENISGPTTDPDLEPDLQTVEFLVEFPDGFSRSLAASFLFVNGDLTAENSQPPFERFDWDLRPYLESGSVSLFVQVVDSMGLIGASTETQVEILVERPRISIWYVLARSAPQLALVVVLFSGAVLLLVLVLGGKIKPKVFGRLQKAEARGGLRVRKSFPPTFSADPLTQPVKGVYARDENPRRLSQWINRLHWPQRQAAAEAQAYLTRMEPDGSKGKSRPIPLMDDEIRIGTDQKQVTMLLNDPSLDGLHARIVKENGNFRLCDQGTTAGTWVNYSPISSEGILLEHGDLVHIGRIGFRFSLREPAKVRKPAVVRKEPGK